MIPDPHHPGCDCCTPGDNRGCLIALLLLAGFWVAVIGGVGAVRGWWG